MVASKFLKINFKWQLLPPYLACFLCVWNCSGMDANNIVSTLVQVMACCCQATSHYLKQCWLKSMLSYDFTRTQWVNPIHFRRLHCILQSVWWDPLTCEVLIWEHFSHCWPFATGIHHGFPHKATVVEGFGVFFWTNSWIISDLSCLKTHVSSS